MSSPRGRARRPLTRTAIRAEALRLVRAEGIEAVTMRRLARELGTAPMSLYRHVEDRQALLVEMLDEVARSIAPPPPGADPRAEITALFTAIHDALRHDAWAVPLIVGDKLAGPAILPILERIFAALRAAGLSPRDAVVAYALLWQYSVGELLDSHPGVPPDTFADRMVHAADPAVHPALAEAARVFPPGPPGDWFAENLQRLLDGALGSGRRA